MASTTTTIHANVAHPTTPATLNILCWACGVLVQVPVVNNELSRVFRCGWCGAISEAAPSGSAHLRPRRRGLWRTIMRTLSHLSYAVVLFVLGLILSIVLPGISIVLPALCTTTASWLLHITISYILTAGVLFNYFAAVATSPGTVLECCDDLPPSFARSSASLAGAPPPANHSIIPSATSAEATAGGADRNPPVSTATAACGGSGGADSVQVAAEGAGALAGGSEQQTAVTTAAAGAACPEAVGPADQAGEAGAAAQPTELVPAGGGGGGGDHYRPLVPRSCYSHLRYCWACRGPQPSCASHCYMCGLCVVDQDHHCPFISNCVGRANTRNFISFLALTILAVTYSATMSAILLAQNRVEVMAALRSAAVALTSGLQRRAALRAPPPLGGSSGGGGVMGRIGGRVLSWMSGIVAGVDMWGGFMMILVSRTPLHLSVAAYILTVSVAILLALSVLLAQSICHATSCGNTAAAARAARHHMHPAEDAAAPGSNQAQHGVLARLHGIMTGVDTTREEVCGHPGVNGDDGRKGGRGGSSISMWIWPIWGPPPGVIVGPAGRARLRTPPRLLMQGRWRGFWKVVGGVRGRPERDAVVVGFDRMGPDVGGLGGASEGTQSSGAEGGRSGMKTKTQ